MDKFLWFCLSKEDKEFLEPYISPEDESSVLKQIPIQYKDRIQDLCLKMGMRVRVVYRGPRLGQVDPSYTRKQDAVAFSVYPIG